MKNFYPEKPVVPYFNAQVEMSAIIEGLKSLDYPAEVKRTAYVIIRNETGNGKSVVCGTNIAGVQSDGARWDSKYDDLIAATCVKAENKTGKERGFVVFNTLDDGISFLLDKVQNRGLYVGGHVTKITDIQVTNEADLAIAYYRSWVTGKPNYTPSSIEISNFTSMYNQAEKLFV
jgi:hypothetical protein